MLKAVLPGVGGRRFAWRALRLQITLKGGTDIRKIGQYLHAFANNLGATHCKDRYFGIREICTLTIFQPSLPRT